MGKSTTYVGTSISPLLGGTPITNSVKQATFSYMMSSTANTSITGYSLTDAIVSARAGNLPNKYKKARSWVEGASEPYVYDNVRGYLEGNRNAAYIDSVLEAEIESSIGYPITVDYSMFDTPHNYHMVWDILINKFGYVPNTNQLETLTAFIGSTCYLYDADMRYATHTIDAQDPVFLGGIGLSFDHGETMTRTKDITRLIADYSEETLLNKDVVRIQYTYRVIETKTTTLGVTTTTTDIVPPTEYDSVTSTVVSDTTTLGTRTVITHMDYVVGMVEDFLLYESSGTPDDTNALGNTNTIDPNAVYIAGDIQPPKDYFMVAYDSSIGRGYFTYEFGSGTNTELDNLFTVGGEYGEYLPRIYCRSGGMKLNSDTLKDTEQYKDSVKLCNKLGLDWHGLTDQIHTAIGELQYVSQIYITTVVPLLDPTELQRRYLHAWFDNQYNNAEPINAATTNFYSSGRDLVNSKIRTLLTGFTYRAGSGYVFKDSVHNSRFSYASVAKKLVLASGDVGTISYSKHSHTGTTDRMGNYTEDYKVSTIILKKQITTTEQEWLAIVVPNSNEVVSGMWAGSTLGDGNLSIPLDLNYKYLFKPNELETFYGECMYVIVNTSQTIKEKWYQSDWFKALTFVIAVILALPTGGQSITIWTVVYAAVSVVITGILLSNLIEIVVDVFNLDVKDVLILVIVVAAYTGNFSTLKQGVLTALKATNIALQLSLEALKNTADDLLNSITEFREFTKLKDEELKEVRDTLLTTGYLLEPSYYTENSNRSFYILGDTPSDYIDRSIHSGNVGTLVFDMVSEYASIMLSLPDAKTVFASMK